MPALPIPGPAAAFAAELLTALRFYTRLPVPPLTVEAAHPPEPFARCLAWAPLAGAVVGACGAAVLAGAAALGLPPSVGALLALGATLLVGGALHEDGLADMADGFGGGRTRERKLAIMRDSRIGTYGALALGLSLLLRAACLAALGERGGAGLAGAALVAAGAASRGFGLLPLARLPPARADGLGHGAGAMPGAVFRTAAWLGGAIGLALPILAGAGAARAALALGLAGLAAAGTTRLAARQVGGFTGDVAGACQQLCEAAMLIGLLVGGRPG
ncbi:adenosylcobinamide-GDP ribazoletransferase [Lichenibacterium ramalinae]|uniref:Adenosylcobinamide-GDP ribazoletransferase n=1 Tax=Lichenibacterium ramalinae TaxID=2316527 RepID=A0A4Q2R7Z6_9HYPH|nr:adenosylcobinamide-GDP ribazoletransferase [Lichenibacterium ramalinae]RYB02862.1 adenosylcobinamide-GDP ribazoletransferase [Lichenibacterium ramalinae]